MIRISDLRFSYPDGKEVLKGINLEIKKGTHNFLVGATGSGKSTLIQTINGLKKGKSKHFTVDGVEMNKKNLRLIRERVGLVMQFPENQIFESTVEKEIVFGLKNRRMKVKDNIKKILEEFSFDYEKTRNLSPFSMSGGEMRKVAIASILVLDPEIIILDEPTCGLDPRSSLELMEILETFKSRGKTIIHISHDMKLACEYGDRVIFLRNGVIRCNGTPEEVFLHEEELLEGGIEIPSAIRYKRILSNTSHREEDILRYIEEEM